jgi:hypothetical protein
MGVVYTTGILEQSTMESLRKTSYTERCVRAIENSVFGPSKKHQEAPGNDMFMVGRRSCAF